MSQEGEPLNLDQVLFRSFDSGRDVLGLIQLLRAVDAVDGPSGEASEARVRELLALPGHDPARDRWVCLDPSDQRTLLGHGLLWRAPGEDTATVHIAVRPDWRRRGVGAALLERSLRRARDIGVGDLIAYAEEQHVAGTSFLAARGFEPVAAYTEMRASAAVPVPDTRTPAGFQIRGYDQIEDPAVFTRAINEAYRGLWGHHEVDEQTVLEWLPELPHDGIFLAFAPDGTIAGLCRVELKEPAAGSLPAYVDAPGLLPQHRGNDPLRVALLAHAMNWLCERSYEELGLESWGDDAHTIQLYSGVGFQVVRRAITYRLILH